MPKRRSGKPPDGDWGGDWTCENIRCRNTNFARRLVCNRCGSPRPAYVEQSEYYATKARIQALRKERKGDNGGAESHAGENDAAEEATVPSIEDLSLSERASPTPTIHVEQQQQKSRKVIERKRSRRNEGREDAALAPATLIDTRSVVDNFNEEKVDAIAASATANVVEGVSPVSFLQADFAMGALPREWSLGDKDIRASRLGTTSDRIVSPVGKPGTAPTELDEPVDTAQLKRIPPPIQPPDTCRVPDVRNASVPPRWSPTMAENNAEAPRWKLKPNINVAVGTKVDMLGMAAVNQQIMSPRDWHMYLDQHEQQHIQNGVYVDYMDDMPHAVRGGGHAQRPAPGIPQHMNQIHGPIGMMGASTEPGGMEHLGMPNSAEPRQRHLSEGSSRHMGMLDSAGPRKRHQSEGPLQQQSLWSTGFSSTQIWDGWNTHWKQGNEAVQPQMGIRTGGLCGPGTGMDGQWYDLWGPGPACFDNREMVKGPSHQHQPSASVSF